MFEATCHCGTKVKGYRPVRFCSRACFYSANVKRKPITDAQFRYRMNILGSRAWVAKTLGIATRVVLREYPIDRIDDLQNGRMVKIGDILAKRCSRCEVTRELHHFYADESTTSGCSPECMICGVNRKYGVDSHYA